VPSGVERAFPEAELPANVREHAPWGDGPSARCAGARSGEVIPSLSTRKTVIPRRSRAFAAYGTGLRRCTRRTAERGAASSEPRGPRTRGPTMRPAIGHRPYATYHIPHTAWYMAHGAWRAMCHVMSHDGAWRIYCLLLLLRLSTAATCYLGPARVLVASWQLAAGSWWPGGPGG
jgi:hypothetical protein